MSSNNSDYDVKRVSDRHGRNIGLLSIAAYFPKTYVSQEDLEAYDKVDSGKYTKGLMQDKMGFCTDLEDINSISMTVLQRLIEEAGVKLTDIGYLEVGTETIVDKSKSVKTVLMELFKSSGNTDIEGVDTTNACYGGTAALFHAIDHCSTDHWDGRLAIVIAADIAVYDKGNARPTGGCGAIAMLIGPNAPLVFDPIRATHMTHTYDFYKPDPYSEYPTVDGKLSLHAYISAVDQCYKTYRAKYLNANVDKRQVPFSIFKDFDSILMHSPYCKLVRKSFARLLFNDYIQVSKSDAGAVIESDKIVDEVEEQRFAQFKKFEAQSLEESIDNRDLEKVAIQLSENLYQSMTAPSLLLSNQIGNMYTASLYSCLVSYLISKPIGDLAGKQALFFSYGSGSAASMFSARLTTDIEAIRKLTSGLRGVKQRLEQRLKVSPEEFTAHLDHRKKTFSLASRDPTGQPIAAEALEKVGSVSVDAYLYPGTFYLTSVDKMFRRQYKRYEAVEENNNNNNINDASSVVMSKNHIQQQQQETFQLQSV